MSNRALRIFLKGHVREQSLRATLKSNFDRLRHPLRYIDQYICSLGWATWRVLFCGIELCSLTLKKKGPRPGEIRRLWERTR